MKKKIIIAASVAALVSLGITGAFFFRNKINLKKTESDRAARMASAPVDVLEQKNAPVTEEDAVGGEAETTTRAAASPAVARNQRGKDFFAEDKRVADREGDLGKIFSPGAGQAGPVHERRLEYNIHAAYRIESIKAARAFFNQWIPRYGFLMSESAAGDHNGYMTLRVRVRSANLYAALNDLDTIGALTSENISVIDHTENGIYQQMLAAREEIRNRRRALANANTGTGSKNWEATENLLSQSEDKQLQTRMEEWRIADRTGWATLQITLSLPATTAPAPVEVPEFRNAFVGLLNVLLQLIYALIYIVPLVAIGYLGYRGILRVMPSLRRLLPSRASA